MCMVVLSGISAYTDNVKEQIQRKLLRFLRYLLKISGQLHDYAPATDTTYTA